jgi:hypothetical protein
MRLTVIMIFVVVALAVIGALTSPSPSSPVSTSRTYSPQEAQVRWERCMQDQDMRPGFCDASHWLDTQ